MSTKRQFRIYYNGSFQYAASTEGDAFSLAEAVIKAMNLGPNVRTMVHEGQINLVTT